VPETFVPPKRPATPDTEWIAEYRNYALAAAFIAAFFEGLGHAWERGEIQVLVALTLASAISLYATLDAKLHGKQYERAFAWFMMFTWPVALLAHFVWTRRGRGVFVYLGWGTLAIVTTSLGYGLAAALAALIRA
jgi:hypothetical protein